MLSFTSSGHAGLLFGEGGFKVQETLINAHHDQCTTHCSPSRGTLLYCSKAFFASTYLVYSTVAVPKDRPLLSKCTSAFVTRPNSENSSCTRKFTTNNSKMEDNQAKGSFKLQPVGVDKRILKYLKVRQLSKFTLPHPKSHVKGMKHIHVCLSCINSMLDFQVVHY